MSISFNPLIQQGILNRTLTAIHFPLFPQLNVTAPFMSKSLSDIEFDGSAVDQIGTATGIVNSPIPFMMATINANILRSQSLVNSFFLQWQLLAVVGPVTIYSDSTVLSSFTLQNCSILNITPGTFDGQDPTTKVMIKGVYYLNNALWAGI